MKNSIKVAVFFIAILCSSQAEAQFFKKLQKKLEEKVERRLEKKADEKTDQALDSVFDSKQKQKRSRRNSNDTGDENVMGGMDLGKMMEAAMNREPATYNQSYTFDVTTTMRITMGRKKPMVMTTSYGDGAHFVDVDNGTAIINDYKNESMITLNKEKKTAQAMSLSLLTMFEGAKPGTVDPSPEDITMTATGNTKNINGYRCKEYLITGQEFKTTGWFTNEVDFDFAKYADSMSEVFKNSAAMMMSQKKIGFPMEMLTTTGGETVKMEVLEISENTTSIDLATYKVSQL